VVSLNLGHPVFSNVAPSNISECKIMGFDNVSLDVDIQLYEHENSSITKTDINNIK